MEKDSIQTIRNILSLLDDEWVISDERDEDDFVVFVDSNRDIYENLKPKKSLISSMESDNLIEIVQRDTEREYMDFEGDSSPTPIPLITIYEITSKGYELLNQG